jgi:hypothetical protein
MKSVVCCFSQQKIKNMFTSKVNFFCLYSLTDSIYIRGLLFFRQSLNYSSQDIGQRFHFFVDKDFSYIEVRILDVFLACFYTQRCRYSDF